MNSKEMKPPQAGLRRSTYEVIFEADTFGGSLFDIALLITIFASILVVMFESVADIYVQHGSALRIAEWAVTIFFTIEYILRLWCCEKPAKYAKSFFGIVDLAAVLPTYVGLFFVGSQYLLVVRSFRLLRMFRILKMTRYLGEAEVLTRALSASRPKILVFLMTVITVVIFVGTLMHMIEGADSGFSSIPISMYWAVVTLTTVGYGNITPQTIPGQMLATLLMICGYGIIAVPTGIVSVELSKASKDSLDQKICPKCDESAHSTSSKFCHLCGTSLS